MRQYIFASHAHFATGIKESTELLSGARDNVHDLSMFVDGRTDVAEEAAKLLATFDPADQVIREILAADDTRVKFVNDLLTDADDEEEF